MAVENRLLSHYSSFSDLSKVLNGIQVFRKKPCLSDIENAVGDETANDSLVFHEEVHVLGEGLSKVQGFYEKFNVTEDEFVLHISHIINDLDQDHHINNANDKGHGTIDHVLKVSYRTLEKLKIRKQKLKTSLRSRNEALRRIPGKIQEAKNIYGHWYDFIFTNIEMENVLREIENQRINESDAKSIIEILLLPTLENMITPYEKISGFISVTTTNYTRHKNDILSLAGADETKLRATHRRISTYAREVDQRCNEFHHLLPAFKTDMIVLPIQNPSYVFQEVQQIKSMICNMCLTSELEDQLTATITKCNDMVESNAGSI